MHLALAASSANLPKAPAATHIDATVREETSDAHHRAATSVVRFPLRYAMAADRIVNDGSRPVVIEGAASTLRQLIATKQERHPSLGAKFIEYEPALPIIEADERTNSIIVRDATDALDADSALVKAIDVRRDTLQIDIHAVDIDRPSFARIAKAWAGDDAQASKTSSASDWHTAVLDDRGQDVLAQLANEGNARPVIEQALSALSGSTASIERTRYAREGFGESPAKRWNVQTWRMTLRPTRVIAQSQSRVELSVVGDASQRAQATLTDGQALVLWFGMDWDDPALSRIRVFVFALSEGTEQIKRATLESPPMSERSDVR